MFAAGQSQLTESTQDSALFEELEMKFELMRLRGLRNELEAEEARVADRKKSLTVALQSPSEASGTPDGFATDLSWRWRLWTVLRGRCVIWWLDVRRGMLASKIHQLSFMEEEVESVLRLAKARRGQ